MQSRRAINLLGQENGQMLLRFPPSPARHVASKFPAGPATWTGHILSPLSTRLQRAAGPAGWVLPSVGPGPPKPPASGALAGPVEALLIHLDPVTLSAHSPVPCQYSLSCFLMSLS